MKKFFISIILIFIFSTSVCYAFSEEFTWSVLDKVVETSSSLTKSGEILDNNFMNLDK